MAKPFKSEFDLMAEAYGTISYDKQQLINEDKAGRRVIGYPPQQGQLINEGVKAEVLAACKQRAVELAGPEAVTTNAGMAVGCKSIYDEYVEGGDTEKAAVAKNIHHHFDEQAKGGFEKTGYKVEDGEGHAEDGEHTEDESPFPTADHDAPEGGIGSRSMDEAEKVDYGPSGEGKPVHPDEAAESAPGMNSRIDDMIDRDALGAAQAALQNILADLHANGEEFEADDVAAFIASTLN
jgi:hypothetical protein